MLFFSANYRIWHMLLTIGSSGATFCNHSFNQPASHLTTYKTSPYENRLSHNITQGSSMLFSLQTIAFGHMLPDYRLPQEPLSATTLLTSSLTTYKTSPYKTSILITQPRVSPMLLFTANYRFGMLFRPIGSSGSLFLQPLF